MIKVETLNIVLHLTRADCQLRLKEFCIISGPKDDNPHVVDSSKERRLENDR